MQRLQTPTRSIRALLVAALAFAATCNLAPVRTAANAGPAASASVLTVKVPLPPTNRATPGSPLILHVEDLKLPPGSSGHVRVYADLPANAEAQLAAAPAAAEPDLADPHYLGSFNVVAKNAAEAAKGIERKSVTLDVSQKASSLAAKPEVALTFVAPRTTPAGGAPEDAAITLRIGKAYFAPQ